MVYKGKLTTTRQRVNAIPYDTETDALAAIMQHTVEHPEDHYSVRQYRGEGFFVLLDRPESGHCWLTEKSLA